MSHITRGSQGSYEEHTDWVCQFEYEQEQEKKEKAKKKPTPKKDKK